MVENRIDFHGRVVVDVGAGSGILSLFAAQVLILCIRKILIDDIIFFSIKRSILIFC